MNFEAPEEPPPPEKFAPTLVEKPKIIPAADGGKAVMEVKVKAKPAPKAVWSKGTTEAKGVKYASSVVSEAGDVYTCRLEVKVRTSRI